MFTVPEGHYFFMGDNRDNSQDSRYAQAAGGVGFVPAEYLIGRADRIMFSSAGSRMLYFWTWRVRPLFQGDRVRLSAELKAFEGRLGHHFAKPELLMRAVTHASIGTATRPDNQRLEFLGDRVLGLVMAEALLTADYRRAGGAACPPLQRAGPQGKLCRRCPGDRAWATC